MIKLLWNLITLKEVIDNLSIQKLVNKNRMLTDQEMLKIAEQFTRKIVDKNFAPDIVLEEAIKKHTAIFIVISQKNFF